MIALDKVIYLESELLTAAHGAVILKAARLIRIVCLLNENMLYEIQCICQFSGGFLSESGLNIYNH